MPANESTTRIGVFGQGLVVGLIGYAAICIVMALGNVVEGQSPFFTAALLGGAVFFGLHDPAQVAIVPATIFAFNGLHLLVMLAFGILASWLASLAERGPHVWYLALLVLLLTGVHALGAIFLLPAAVRREVLDWRAVLALSVAVIAIAGYFVATHRAIRSELLDFAANDPDLIDHRS